MTARHNVERTICVTSRQDETKPRARAGKKASRPVLPLSLLIEEYARDLRRRDIQPKTILDYTSILNWASRIWEQQLERPPTLDDFTVARAEAFLDYLLEHGKDPRSHRLAEGTVHSPATLRTYVRTLKIFSTWLTAPKQQYSAESRLKLLPMPRKVRTYKRPLTTEEMQALISVCDVTTVLGTRDLALLLTFLDGGLRVSDVLTLQVGQVNLEAGQLFIASGKGRRTRQVTLGADARRILQRYAFLRDATAARKANAEEPFFQTDVGAAFKYQGLRSWLMRLKRAAGVTRAFPHLLRHTSAVQMLEVPGADLYTLQEKLGHADIATTREYLKMTGQQLSERQRAFSPIDHLGLDGLMRQPSPLPHVGRLWHKRVEGVPESRQQKSSSRQPREEEQTE
jgi:integrase/recombinase XerD